MQDTAAGLSASIAALKTLVNGGQVSTVTQTDSATATISLTAQQMTDNAAVLTKLNSAAKLNITNVSVVDGNTVLKKSNVVSVALSATKADVLANLDDLKIKIAAGTLTGISLIGTDTSFSSSVDDIIANSAVYEKITSKYSVTPTDTTVSAASLASMSAKIIVALKGSIKIGGTTSDISKNIDNLNTLGTQVTTLNISDQSTNAIDLTSTQLSSTLTVATLKKISGAYKVNVTNVLAANANTIASTTLSNQANQSVGTVATVSISDTAANIVKSLTTMSSSVTKIKSITQSDVATSMISLTQTQMTSSASLLTKLDASAKINVTSVSYADMAEILKKKNVASVGLSMTTTEIAANISDLKAKVISSQISAIGLSTGTNTLTLSASDIADNSQIFAKITGKLSLAVSSSTITTAQLSNLDAATIALLPATTKLNVTGSADDIKSNFDKLQALLTAKKLATIRVSGDANITLSAADAKKYATTLAVVQGAKITAQFSGNYNQYKVVQGAGGSFTITDNRAVTAKESTALSGINFIKFADITTFASSGNANVDAVLNGGQNMWWYNDTGAASSTNAIDGSFTMLNSNSSKASITYSFLTPEKVDATATAAEKAMTEMNSVQKQGVRDAFAYLATLVNVTFTESNEIGKADINFGMNVQDNSAGYANPPHASGQHHSYLFLASNASTNNTVSIGSYGWETIVHEIGHTMGLKHPANVNANGGGAPQPYLPATTNNRNFSIMSYTDATNTNDVSVTYTAGKNNSYSYSTSAVNPATFMTYDIAALQFLYGANTKEETTNVTFASNYKGISTIYAPVSGNVDASATSQNNIFDLRSGAYSSIGYSEKAQILAQLKTQNVADATAVSIATTIMNKLVTTTKPPISTAYDGLNNTGLAFGSHIASVKGGAATDRFYVNGIDNVSIDGGKGTDDTVYLAGTEKDWKFVDSLATLVAAGGSLNESAKLTNGKEVVNLANVEKYAFYNADTSSLIHTA